MVNIKFVFEMEMFVKKKIKSQQIKYYFLRINNVLRIFTYLQFV